jgi:hypothetical protein
MWTANHRSFSTALSATAVSEQDALHAYAFAVDAFTMDETMVMYVGPDRSGRLLEVGVVQWHDELAIVHAMPARPKFLRR